jgi:hypothetical protein
MILEFNDTPEGLVVDIEVVAGIPYKGYDERAPHDGFLAAAGLNEMMTAPLIARQKGSYDWEESINAITRHAIEEFSNLQHFVPYLYEKYTLLGKAGINWVPTLGTWMQYNKWQMNDGSSISFYNALAAMAKHQIQVNSTAHTALVENAVGLVNQTFLHATKVAEAANIAKAQAAYVQLSNAATKAAYTHNQANGAQPEKSNGMQDLARAIVASMKNATGHGSTNYTAQIHNALAATGSSVSVTHSSGGNGSDGSRRGLFHSLGKGFTFNNKRVAASGSN